MKVDVFTEPPRWRRLRRRKVYRERSLLMTMASRAHLQAIVHDRPYAFVDPSADFTVESAVEAAVGSRAAAVYWAWKDAA